MKAIAYKTRQQDDDGYDSFLSSLRERFRLVTAHTPHLFTTDAEGLFFEFLGALPSGSRQHYTCHACRRFVERYGGLVSLDAGGNQRPVMWDTEAAPGIFVDAVERMDRAVRRAKVTGVFLTDATVWGEPTTGPWNHMAVTPDRKLLAKRSALLTFGQQMSEKVQDYLTLRRGLSEFSTDHVRKAKALLESDALYRSEKVLGVATWMLDLQERLDATKDRRAEANMVWLAVATAPPGFCHVRSTMIGTLLEDISAGLPFDDIARKFRDKMGGLNYQRPQAAPSAGQIDAAERLVEKLGVARSMRRRFARLEDLQTIWRPKPIAPKGEAEGGVFAHLRPGSSEGPIDTGAPPATMTWCVFARDVLPKAERIELQVPSIGSFMAHVTACDPEAPNLLQWNNPVDWYVYQNGSIAGRWNLRAGEFAEVVALALAPHLWPGNPPMPHQQDSVALVVNGARDMGYVRGALFFPESIRNEYHGIRAVIEAHSKGGTLEGRDEATACGLNLVKGAAWGVVIRVTSGGVRTLYRLDRWE